MEKRSRHMMKSQSGYEAPHLSVVAVSRDDDHGGGTHATACGILSTGLLRSVASPSAGVHEARLRSCAPSRIGNVQGGPNYPTESLFERRMLHM
jgi:hypothetical protein